MSGENPYQPPRDSAGAHGENIAALTLGEKIYTAAVILAAGFLLASLASFHFLLIPRSKEPDVFYFVAAILWINFIGITTTVVLNLRARQLLVIPTIIQCVILCLMMYFAPFGIWGAVMLYRRVKRNRGT